MDTSELSQPESCPISPENMLTSPKQMLSRFYLLQEERVQTYQLFDEGFQAYLKGAPNYNFPMYRQLVHEITETFKKISEEILQIKSSLASQNNLVAIATIINKIQEAEQAKLELTARLQLSSQKRVDKPEDETVQEDIQSTKQELQEKIEYIIEQMEELKYESEDLYTEETEETSEDRSPDHSNSTVLVDR